MLPNARKFFDLSQDFPRFSSSSPPLGPGEAGAGGALDLLERRGRLFVDAQSG
jgi:hypothetical protein